MAKLFDRVKVNIATTGTGDITFGAASSNAFLTPTEAGCVDTDTVRYVIVDGTDFEEGIGTIKNSVTEMERTNVTKSKIGGTAGTSKINLSGSAVLAFTASAADIVNTADVTTVGEAVLSAANEGAAQTAIGGTTVGKALFTAADASTAANSIGIIPALKNALINGAMDIWQRGTLVSCPSGNTTYTADRWFVKPVGATVTALRSAFVGTNARSRYSNQLTSEASITTVNVGQRIEAANVPQIKGTVVFQAQIYTGADFTPSLLLGTPASADDFTTVTNRLTQVLQSCANGTYTQVSFSADISGYTNIDNGLQVELQFPSGILDVKITEVSLQLGTVPTTFERPPISITYNLCLPYYQKSFPYAISPAQNLGNNDGAIVTVTAGTVAGSGAESIKFLPPMRAVPTVTTYNPQAANANWWDSNASASRAVASANLTEKGFRATVNATTTAASQHFIQWAADAEL